MLHEERTRKGPGREGRDRKERLGVGLLTSMIWVLGTKKPVRDDLWIP